MGGPQLQIAEEMRRCRVYLLEDDSVIERVVWKLDGIPCIRYRKQYLALTHNSLKGCEFATNGVIVKQTANGVDIGYAKQEIRFRKKAE